MTGALVATLWAAPAARAGEMSAELDCTAHPELLDKRFVRYPTEAAKLIVREPDGHMRFQLPEGFKDLGQVGLYSYVGMKGDFEVSAAFEWGEVFMPEGGYGVSCGIAVDTESADGLVQFARGFMKGKDKGSGYIVSRGKPAQGKMEFTTEHFPAKARSGRLMLKREQAELICLVDDDPKEPLKEICRMPFSKGPVRKVRLFADPGGSPTAMDVRLGQVRLRAEEISGAIPLRDVSSTWGWWLAGGGTAVGAAGLGYWLWRRRREVDD